ncbi:MAG: hypothetical protein NC338_04230 [Firmicutes bacterium]|nr:hypothetical protein [Bacillota bacterium]MCM1401496.1 hypothetical protein [Bacteroides sp.]MCM1477815.1 hypothetical protein [Bacteroides sp.]
MKKTLLSFLTLGCMLAASAAQPTLLWHKMIDSERTGDFTRSMTVTTDGNLVTLGEFGSREETDNISFDGTVIANGAATNSNSDNYNMLVTKHNATDGSLIWTISTKKGDVTSMGTNAIAPTADGGVVMLVVMRSSNVTPYESPVIVDASKAEIDFPDWNTSCWMKNQVVIKVSKDGNVEWVRRILADQTPVPNASSGSSVDNTTDAAFNYCVAEDKDGNIIVAGNHRAPLIFTGDRNSIFVVQARNLDSYSGDVQKAAGGLYLVKLDSEGNYLTHLQGSTEGNVTADYINLMAVDGDFVYFTGNFNGSKECSLTLGKGAAAKTVTKSVAENGMLLGCVEMKTTSGKHSFVPKYLTCLIQKASTTFQFKGMRKINQSLYLTGLFKGEVYENGSATAILKSVGNPLEGYVLKLSAEDASVEAAYANGMSIGGYFDAFEHDGKLYCPGYQMSTGTFIHELDANTLELISKTDVAKKAVAFCAGAYDPKMTRIFSTSRANNAQFELTDGTTTEKTKLFGMVLTAHAVDATIAGVESVDAEVVKLQVNGVEGGIEVVAATDTRLEVVDTKGMIVYNAEITAGNHIVNLPAGIYIANGVKVAVR